MATTFGERTERKAGVGSVLGKEVTLREMKEKAELLNPGLTLSSPSKKTPQNETGRRCPGRREPGA